MMLTDIAQCFSIGQFSQIQPYFSEDIVWEIVGEQRLSGIDQVLKHCQSIEQYFKLTPHEFQIQSIHQADHHVIIQGEAYFHNGNQTTHISACDVYTFNDLNQLVQVQSYCISIQK
ncbi:nuclear transport factor 2 family protein [Acinetobacter lwoffii]|jgi:hypothetical protein|uniref:Nuclear transport factor 2 family protein n=1 Tax=Acinetobacter lwoffii TaxID=28090 RepID=A0AAW8B0A3_ACILW|nr:nuclear transport factor 2 family protein [Acinetobacter lwoffii]MDP1372262.1 nuclear transport factor 2 family protein [Acinetobacter lwoffii]MDP1391664.1 nuclear transport factor 2 family protein [Acinetobacter lwoffii]MDP1449347.1 nuclear transport factor 2 family protein [Acinetobacter lwoffii]MRA04627.1 nuclear transport factor 2 family protein [Acinetobacter lwoffii]UHT65805.1 hypothetical protein ABEDC_2634 [Acinetobacter lwoffii]